MSRRRTVGAALLVALATVASAVPAVGTTDAKKKPKGPKLDFENACTMVWSARVEKAFGTPVTILPQDSVAGPAACSVSVGTDPAVAPGGTFQAITEFPTIFNAAGTARGTIEDRRAGDALTDDVLTDVDDVGIGGYFNRTKGTISIAASKKFAFTLQWNRSGDVEITDADRKQLTALAKNVVARAKR